jgi:hypothetical protein
MGITSLKIIGINSDHHNLGSFFNKNRPDLFDGINFTVPFAAKGKVFTALLASQFRRFPRAVLDSLLHFGYGKSPPRGIT